MIRAPLITTCDHVMMIFIDLTTSNKTSTNSCVKLQTYLNCVQLLFKFPNLSGLFTDSIVQIVYLHLYKINNGTIIIISELLS